MSWCEMMVHGVVAINPFNTSRKPILNDVMPISQHDITVTILINFVRVVKNT